MSQFEAMTVTRSPNTIARNRHSLRDKQASGYTALGAAAIRCVRVRPSILCRQCGDAASYAVMESDAGESDAIFGPY